MKCTVLIENSSLREDLKKQHGLSFFIEQKDLCTKKDRFLLLDAGQNDDFYHNAQNLGIDIKKVDVVVCSHAHYDHVGGMNTFCTHNKIAPIYTFWDGKSDYLSTTHCLPGEKERHIGFYIKDEYKNRLKICTQKKKLFDGCYFCPVGPAFFNAHFPYPYKNRTLFERKPLENSSYEIASFHRDCFNHEGALVFEVAENELAVFNSCSHNGVINTIECVESLFPKKEVVYYVGGFHFPWKKEEIISDEDMKNIEDLSSFVNKREKIQLFSAHCTEEAALCHLEKKLQKKFRRLSTGMSFNL